MAKVTIELKELRSALQSASVAVGKNAARAQLEQVHVLIGKSAVFTATDGHRLSRYDAQIVGKADAGEYLLPRAVLRDMLKLCKGKGSATLHFETGTAGREGKAVFPKGTVKKLNPVQRAKAALQTAHETGRPVKITGDDAKPEFMELPDNAISIAERKALAADTGAHVIEWETPQHKFPSVEPILVAARKGKTRAEVDRALLINAVKIADIAEKIANDNPPVRAVVLAFQNDTARVESEGFNCNVQGGTQVDVPCSFAGECEVGFNAPYLLAAFKAFPSDTVHFQIAGPLNPVIIHGGDYEKQFVIQMPLRVEFSALAHWDVPRVYDTTEPVEAPPVVEVEHVKPVIVTAADTQAKDCPPEWDCPDCGRPMFEHKAKFPLPAEGGNLMECPAVVGPEPVNASAYTAEHWQTRGLAVYGSPLGPVAEALTIALPKASIQERKGALILSRKHEPTVREVLDTLNRAA